MQVPSTFTVVLTDPNPQDTLHARWAVDYPPFVQSRSRLVVDEQTLPPGPSLETQYAMPDMNPCTVFNGTSNHRIVVIVSDRPFRKVDQFVGEYRFNLVEGGGSPDHGQLDHPQLPMTTRGMVMLGLLAWTAACRGSHSADRCASDAQCGGSESAACVMGICLPRGANTAFAIELSPRVDSMSAPTELVGADLDTSRLRLEAEPRTTVTGTAVVSSAAASAGLFGTDGHVTAFLPSAIPGRDDQQLDADMADSKFTLAVRRSVLGSPATLWILPTSKAVAQPPVEFATPLGPNLRLSFPTPDQLSSLGGSLVGPLGDPVVGFVAQAKLAATGQIVSNSSTTNDRGRFELKLAPQTVPAGDVSADVIVDLAPPGGDDAQLPHFVSGPVSVSAMATALSTFHMPAFGTPAPIIFTVRANDGGAMRPLSEVMVKFRTEIAAQPDGAIALYEREASTDASGEVPISLIPGTANQARIYQVVALPSPDSPYASKCLPRLSITVVGGGASQPPYSATLLLDRKVSLNGTVLDSGGEPAPGLSITATPTAGATDCVDAQSPDPVTTTTNRSGAYALRLNPGAYRLDLEPAQGSPYPRLTLDGPTAVTVTEDTSEDLTLPAGGVLEGDAVAADGSQLPSATLRFFEVLCAGDTCSGEHRLPPALRAQTRSDMSGHFQAVVPLE